MPPYKGERSLFREGGEHQILVVLEMPAVYRFPLLLGGENPTDNLPNVTKLFGVV
ncbi:hypothetical protein [Cylindrospermopsis raciborskii]|uniref:hypothetical protein n=1 Tax=Cylindrospermopsis raciborskii TaxID=77022 RepID=UPI001F354185|nr:hypothetical protein [Cylindrospermopsis raciborskii]UJS05574.1 hypothetical protein L3I90_04870 [Cylindrospermopsis raciborskii KLL07]